VLAYQAVGFGSHHWGLTDEGGGRWFVTVDDLRTRRRFGGEPLVACHERLRAALSAAQGLRAAGRDFVVAPVPAVDGEPLALVGEAFAVAVYPLISGESFDGDSFTPEDRRAVLDLLVGVHTAPLSDRALVDDYGIQFRDVMVDALDGVDPESGPYSRLAAALISGSAPGIRRALARYGELVSGVRAEPPRLVMTHGEPHPGNTIRTDAGLVLVDWDTALIAPPERDLWDLGSLWAAYTAATGTGLRPELFELYRLRWDLTEIAVCLARFREPHGDTADDKETWANLQESVANVAG
jgi:hypothetical protein